MIIQHYHTRYLTPSSNLKIKYRVTIVLLICFQIAVNNFAQNKSLENHGWFVTTIKHLEKNIDIANERITRYENEIAKCDKTIATSEKLINLAREKGNSEAEKVASDALVKSKGAKDKNVKLLESAKNLKRQSEYIFASVKRELSISSSSKSIEALTLNYSGNISVQKSNGEQYSISDSGGSLLENGDLISTSANGKIELQLLEGRGNLLLGENSKLKFSNSDSLDAVDFINGKVKIAVEKIDNFEKRIKEAYEKVKQDVGSLPESYEQFMNRQRAKMKKKFEVRIRAAGTASIRGTEFIVVSDNNIGAGLIVLEGEVEMNSKDGLKTVMIKANQKGVFDSEGNLLEPQNIDLKTIENWWVENE